MYSSTYIHLFIDLYSSQNTAVSTATRHWAGQPRIKVQCLAGARALLQSTQTGSGPVQPPTQWVSGLFLQGKTCQNMKLTTHHPHPQPYLHPPEQNYTTTHVTPSWHVDTASLHIHIILSFQNLSLEIGLQPTHKFLQNATKALHIPLFCVPDY